MKVSEIVELYINSRAFIGLSKKTKKSYEENLKIFERKFGKYSALKVSQADFAFELEDFIYSMQKMPRKTSYVLQNIKILFHWAVKRKILREFVINDVSFTYRPRNTDTAWTEKDIRHVCNNSSQAMQDFIFLALETGLRRCDLINVKYTDIIINHNKQNFLKINQSKTQQMVIIALSSKLDNWLMKRDRKSEYILTSSNGLPWTEIKFCSAWGRLRKSLKLKNINPHGLRKTTVRRLAEAGCSVPEIASILGWSLDTAQKMLEKHYFTNRMSVASNAIDKLNNMRMSEQYQINSAL